MNIYDEQYQKIISLAKTFTPEHYEVLDSLAKQDEYKIKKLFYFAKF